VARSRGPDPVTAGLAALRGSLPVKPPNARTLAAIRANPACNARRVLDAAGVDKAVLAAQLGHRVSEEQSKFALQRGNRFERLVKDDNYAELIRLLREAGYPVEAVRVLPSRDIYPINPRSPSIALAKRAAETKNAIIAMAEGKADAYNLIDGGALQWDFGGAIARLEADGIAWRIGDQIRVVEIKSFPVVDRRARQLRHEAGSVFPASMLRAESAGTNRRVGTIQPEIALPTNPAQTQIEAAVVTRFAAAVRRRRLRGAQTAVRGHQDERGCLRHVRLERVEAE
jgi:hypothetical protein